MHNTKHHNNDESLGKRKVTVKVTENAKDCSLNRTEYLLFGKR